MAYSAFAVAGTTLAVTISATPTTIKGVEGFSGPTGTKEEIDVTGIDDTAKVYVTGMPDFGSVSFTLYWDPAEAAHQHLFDSYKTANSKDTFTITCADAGDATIVFEAAVNEWQWDFGKGNAATVKVSAKLTGLPTVTP